jgi:hypothetical protein
VCVSESQLTNETAATKIVELSKKIRDLTAEMESERTKSKQFQRKCQELQTQVAKFPHETTIFVCLKSQRLGSTYIIVATIGIIQLVGFGFGFGFGYCFWLAVDRVSHREK